MGLYKAKEVWTGTLASSIPDATTTSFTLTSSSGLTNGETYVFTIDRVDVNGTKTPNKKEVIIGTVSGSNVIDCIRGVEGTAQAHSAGAIVEILFTAKHWNNLIESLKAQHREDGSHKKIQGLDNNQAITQKDSAGTERNILNLNSSNDLEIGGSGINKLIFNTPFDGWIAANETWTFSSWDASVYTGVITVPLNATTKYSPGMRIKITQSTGGTKYGIITAVSSTSLTVFFGTDYTLNNEAISNPYYSPNKAPLGFPLNPEKWTVQLTDNVFREKTNPSQNVWYNLSPLSIMIPIGIWEVEYKACISGYKTSTTNFSVFSTLSTANNTESDSDFTCYIFTEGANASPFALRASIYRKKVLNLSIKTTYYLNIKTEFTGGTSIGVLGSASKTIIRAICAYL